jgi:uncharacterized peroxidase-related enzyme
MAARIKPNDNPSPKAKEQLEGVKKMLGNTPNIFTTLAHSPAALGFYLGGITALSGTKIPGALREQIALTVAGTNTCDYCASAHTFFGKMQKIPENELAQNLMGKSGTSKTEAALRFANQIVKLRGNVSDSDLQAIRDAGYSEEEIVEIVAIVCQNIFTNYFNHVADTEVDFPKVSTTLAHQASSLEH